LDKKSKIKDRKYLTINYVCSECSFTVKVKTLLPTNKSHHALNYNQAIDSMHCLKCKLIKGIKNCTCNLCQEKQ